MRRMRVGRLPVQEPVKKERNWRSIFKRTLDKINEGFNAADDEEI